MAVASGHRGPARRRPARQSCLASLIRLHRARTAARFTPEGTLVRLEDQDRTRWDHGAITAAATLPTHAIGRQRPGRTSCSPPWPKSTASQRTSTAPACSNTLDDFSETPPRTCHMSI
ncbi:DUF6596 domain-containing protein [Streptomyces sp. NPDC049627]|uniref:DUF6596 domain-containing protein n=1 Tax=Streptomyces sp. NPDC049627 TaxID=3365595 RepID=UPI0037A332AE